MAPPHAQMSIAVNAASATLSERSSRLRPTDPMKFILRLGRRRPISGLRRFPRTASATCRHEACGTRAAANLPGNCVQPVTVRMGVPGNSRAALQPRTGRQKVASGASPWTSRREAYQPRQGRQTPSAHRATLFRPSGAARVLLDSTGLRPWLQPVVPPGLADPGCWARRARSRTAISCFPWCFASPGNRKTGRIANNPSFSEQAIPTKKPGKNYSGFLLDPV